MNQVDQDQLSQLPMRPLPLLTQLMLLLQLLFQWLMLLPQSLMKLLQPLMKPSQQPMLLLQFPMQPMLQHQVSGHLLAMFFQLDVNSMTLLTVQYAAPTSLELLPKTFVTPSMISTNTHNHKSQLCALKFLMTSRHVKAPLWELTSA